MSAYNNSHIFVNSGRVSFSWLGFPALEFIGFANHGILYIFLKGLSRWFFDDFSYFGVKGR